MSYATLYPLLAGLISYALGCFITRRIYRRKLAAAQADAKHGWAEYQEVLEMAARWKRLYYNILDRA